MASTQSYDAIFDSLLIGVGSKDTSVLTQNRVAISKLTKLTSPAHAKEFLQNSRELENQYQEKISGLNFQKSELSSVLNELFIKKPKRNNDKVMLSTEIRTGWVNFYKDLHSFWEKSESKKEISYLAGIESLGDKDVNNTTMDDKNEARTRRQVSAFRQSISLQKQIIDDYSPGSTGLRKNILRDLDKNDKSDKSDTNSVIEERKRDNSPQIQNAALIEEQRLAAERERQRIEEENRKIKLQKEAEEKARQEQEKARKLEERINKKVQAYLVQIPDFGPILKNSPE